MHLFRFTESEAGETGSVSPGKITGFFLALVACYVSVDYFWIQKVGLTNNEWLIGTFGTGIMSIGFYAGAGKALFTRFGDALVDRIRGGPSE